LAKSCVSPSFFILFNYRSVLAPATRCSLSIEIMQKKGLCCYWGLSLSASLSLSLSFYFLITTRRCHEMMRKYDVCLDVII
jgi:hypothetical protein